MGFDGIDSRKTSSVHRQYRQLYKRLDNQAFINHVCKLNKNADKTQFFLNVAKFKKFFINNFL